MRVIITLESTDAEKVAKAFKEWGIGIRESVPYNCSDLWVEIDASEIRIEE